MEIIVPLLILLVATVLIELGVLRLFGERSRRVLWASVVVNILTNVPLNLFLMFEDGGWEAVLMGELLVMMVEILWYYWSLRALVKAFMYGFFCNVVSFLAGVLFLMIVDYMFYCLN